MASAAVYRIKAIILFILFMPVSVIYSQQADEDKDENHTFSLQECINYGMNNHPAVKKAKLDKQIADTDIGVTRSSGLPQISGKAEVTHNTQLQPIFAKGGTQITPQLPPDEIAVADNFFQLPTSGEVSASLNQMIFNGSFFVGLQASKTYKEMMKKSVEQARKEVTEQIAKGYYSVLISEERMQLLESNIARVDSLLKNTQALHENGYAEKIDVNRVQVNLNNLKTEQENLKNSLSLSKDVLKYQMGMPLSNRLTLSSSLDSLEKDDFLIIEENEPNVYQDRIEYSILQTQRNLYQLDLKNVKVSYLPSLNFFANAGYINQRDGIEKELFTTEWYDFSLIGINMNIPIFSGAERHYQLQKAKLNLEKNQQEFRDLENSIDLEIKRAKTNLQNSLKTLESQKENMALAREVTENTRKKYNEGVKNNLEVVTAETDYKEARVNYFNALFEAYTHKIDYLKAKGNLTHYNFNK